MQDNKTDDSSENSKNNDSNIKNIFSVSSIKPIDFSDLGIQQSWSRMLSHGQRKNLEFILQIRTLINEYIFSALRKRGFVHPPVHIFSTCVDPLNHETEPAGFNYYGQECTLMQSLIFHKMVFLSMSGIKKVFWVSPNIRKEMHITNLTRYATEFSQIDFESSVYKMDKTMDLIEEVTVEMLKQITKDHKTQIQKISGRDPSSLIAKFPRIDVSEEARSCGIDPDDVEKKLALELKTPFFLTNMKREAYDYKDPQSGKYHNYDLVFPITGEVLSGGEREHSYDRLKHRMEELDYPLDYFAPVLKFAKEVGFNASSGAGFGVERLTRGLLLLDDIAEVYAFRRVPGEKIIF